MRFKKVEDEILPILKFHKATRCNDMYLYYKYVEIFKNSNLGLAFSSNKYRIVNNIAPYETVSRVRRKLQEKYPELRPTEKQKEEKKRAEKEYIAYARGKGK